MATPEPAAASAEEVIPPGWVNTRAIVYAVPGKILPVKVAKIGTPAAIQSKTAVLNEAATPWSGTARKLIVTQSPKDIGFQVVTGAVLEGPPTQGTKKLGNALYAEVYYDPGRDRMVFINRGAQSVKLSMSDEEDEGPSMAHAPFKIDNSNRVFLECGLWNILTESDQLFLQISLLPRPFSPCTRSIAIPQGLTISFPIPTPEEAVDQSEQQPAPQVTSVSDELHSATDNDQDSDETQYDRHPLEKLQPGTLVAIPSPHGDYSIMKSKTIVAQKNTIVMKGLHSNLPQVVVVKVLRTPSRAVESGSRDAAADKIAQTARVWLREVRNLTKIPQIEAMIRLYDADARMLSIYMEHVEAPDLESYVNENDYCSLEVDDARHVMSDTLHALDHIHEHGIMHCDIKPGNILFSPSRGAVLIDFGLSADLSESNFGGGTSWYIAPEYPTTGKRGAAADVYALGVVMVFVLGSIPLPESRSHVIKWKVGDLRADGAEGNTARHHAGLWHQMMQLAAETESGIQDDRMQALVRDMLRTEPEERVTAKKARWEMHMRTLLGAAGAL